MPTAPDPLTARGTIVGTLPYMAPEQLEGKPADARTDLWSLGTILYEMVAGTRAFEGTSSVSLIGHIMNTEPPPLATRQPLTPPALEHVVRKCLAKQAENRWGSAHDVADELRWISQTGTVSAEAPSVRRARWTVAGLATALVVTAVAAGVVLWRFRSAPAEFRPVTRLDLTLPAGVELYRGTAPSATLSPDGRSVVFVGVTGAVRQLYVRALDRFEAFALRSTASSPPNSCFFSPDGRAVGLISSSGVLYRVTLADGLVVAVTRDVDFTAGGAWGADGRMTFVRAGTLWQVAAAGGAPQRLTTLDARKGEVLHAWPTAIRGGETILFTSVTGSGRGVAHIEAVSVGTGQRRVLIESGTFPQFASSGHLIFFRDGALLAAPLDVEHLDITGPPVRVLENVEVDNYGAPLAAVSGSGSLVYVAQGTNLSQLVRVSRQGLEQPITDTPRRYVLPRLSPDGRRIVVGEGGILWMQDTGRAAFTRLTSEESIGNSWPAWTPDGRRVVFRTLTGLRWIDADGAGQSRAG
jgi:serine/threonine-protein kinase